MMSRMCGTVTKWKFQVGEKVEANDWTHTGTWRPAIIVKQQPYRGQPGYDVLWLDIKPGSDPNTGVMPPQGGWVPETNLRKE